MLTDFKSVLDLLKVFKTEQDCIKYFEKIRWKGKVISPLDPNSKVYKCANNQYRCKNTGKYFNAKTGTVFESSKIPLKKWFLAFYVFVNHKKGISSQQLAKWLDITQKSAWFLLHRLRYTSNLSLFKEMLKGFVEIDETFIGGKNKNRHRNKKVPNSQGRSWKDKVPVLGMLERNGNLVAQVISNTQQNTIEPIIKENIKKGSNVYTDEWHAYKDLHKNFNHQIVNHSIKQYVNKNASTNAIENVWSHLKRSINGTYHWVSKKHTQKYIDEFALRFNTQKHDEQQRFNLLLLSSLNNRLTYQTLIN